MRLRGFKATNTCTIIVFCSNVSLEKENVKEGKITKSKREKNTMGKADDEGGEPGGRRE